MADVLYTQGKYGQVPLARYSSGMGSVSPSMPPPARKRGPRGPAVVELGATGTHIQMGIITGEEFNPDLTWKEGIRTWDTMRRTDPNVASTLLMLELPIRAADWRIAPGTDDPRDIEIASFVETNLFHKMRRSFDDFIRHAMLMKTYGFMPFEVTFRNEAGKTILNDIAPRLPRTIYRWWVDADNHLTAIQQWVWRDGRMDYVNIPMEQLLLFTNRMEGNNYEGISALRTAYKPWWYKSQFERIIAVGYEREHIGIPLIHLPEGYSKKDTTRAETIGKNLRGHEQAYIALAPGWDIEWMKSRSSERKGSTMLEMMYYLDRQVQQNILAQFMSLGTTDVGSYAMSNDQSRVFLMSLQADANYYAYQTGKGVIEPLVNYNYGEVDVYPELICRKIHAYNFMDLTTAISNLVSFGVLPVTMEMEDYVYDLLGIPVPPRNVVEATNPIGSRGTPVERLVGAQNNPNGNKTGNSSDNDPSSSASGNGFHEVYNTTSYKLMDHHQKKIYTRMAQDAIRPKFELRIPGGATFASASPSGTKESRLQRRLDAEIRVKQRMQTQLDTLTQDLEDLMDEASEK